MLRKILGRFTPLRRSETIGFDEKFYLSNYPDVARSGQDPLSHFMLHGWREGRNPSATFHTLFFKDKYLAESDVAVNPLEYYQNNQTAQQLKTAPNSKEEYIEVQKRVVRKCFDEFFYRKRGADLAPGTDALDHYLRTGWLKGREPSPTFSTSEYLKIHPHIAVLGVSPFYHYASLSKAGSAERGLVASRPADTKVRQNLPLEIAVIVKAISGEFDAEYYLNRYSDVRTAKIDPLKHYVEFGWREGRDPNALFSTAYYLSKYGDIRQWGGNPLYHYVAYGRREGRKPNPVGSILWERPKAPSDTDWSLAFPAKNISDADILVIMPVYKGYADTLAAIHSVLTNRQNTIFELLVINDQGPDEALNAKLRDLADSNFFTYLENEKNLGFSGTINRGLAHRPELDVILLNSDVVVFGDWIDRLQAHARSDNSIATITPMSNNATICSYPDINKNNLIGLEVSPADLDKFARTSNRGRNSVLPTGIGFCFYMRRKVIDIVGDFDAVSFPRGYGEENDYCMRALKAGFKNIFAHDVFVYHTGQISFASFAASSYGPGQATLLRKHPDYSLRVQRYLKADPAREARIRLDLYRLAQTLGRNSAVFITHALGGGIVTHIRNMAARLASENINVLYIKVGVGGAMNIALSLHKDLNVYTPSLEPILVSKFPELLSDFLDWLQPAIIHVHSFAGLNWSGTSALMEIIGNAGVAYDCTLHDFTPICHRHQFVTPEGLYCGQPGIRICRACVKADQSCVDPVDPEIRRSIYGAFLKRAAHLFVPSFDTAARFKHAFFDLDLNLVVRPHEEFPPETAAWPPVMEEFAYPLRIAIIGAIGAHKGSGVVHDLALDARQRSLPIEFTIIGYSNMADDLKTLGVKETGRYASDAEAVRLLQDARPHIAFFPSIWPETYCYALSLALAAGIPPVVFDIGAPAERLRDMEAGQILDFSLVSQPPALNDALLALPLAELWRNRRALKSTSYPSIVRDYYGLRANHPATSEI